MEERTATATWCPGCGRPAGEVSRCPSCGLPQTGADADRLRVVVWRLYELGERQRALLEETAALRRERGRLLHALGQGAAAPAGTTARREWRPEMIRGVLLGLGSVLVAIAALIFAVVAWVRLGDLGRAGLLAAATLVAAAASAATRRRLPATGEALAGLALALLLVDWYALRRGGLGGGWSATAWWALGSGAGAAVAAVAAVAARWLRLQRVAAPALAQVSAALTVLVVAEASWTVGVGLALAAAASAAGGGWLGGRAGWRGAAVACAAGAVLLDLGAVGLALGSPPVTDLAAAAGPAAVLAAVALAPAAALAVPGSPARRGAPDVLVAVAAGALLAGAGTLLAARWESWSLPAAVAVLGAAAVGLSRPLPRAVRRGSALAAGATLAVGVAGLLEPLLQAVLAPLVWAATGPLVVALLACAGAAGLAAAPWRGPRLVATGAAAAVAAAAATGVAAALPLAAGWPLWAALLLPAATALAAVTGAVAADRVAQTLPPPDRGAGAVPPDRVAQTLPPPEHYAGGLAARVLAGCAAALLVLAAGWALAAETGTLAFLGAVAVPAALATAASRSGWLRQGCAAVAAVAVVGECAAAAVGAGGGAAEAGFVVAAAAGAVLVVGTRWRRRAAEGPVLEALGLGMGALGALLAGWEGRWLAAALTAAVPALLAAGAWPVRRAYLWSGAAVAVAATWAWLAAAGVTAVEAYTLPAAAVALAAGALARRGEARPGSWLAFGPGLAVALLPSLVLAVDRDGRARPLLLTAAALLVLLAGARAGLQAPLVLGAVTLLGLGADAVLPVAAQLPRWITIGLTGLLLLWLGATAERQLTRLSHAWSTLLRNQ